MAESAERPQRQSLTGRLARAQMRGVKQGLVVGGVAISLGGIAAEVPSRWVNDTFRHAVDFNVGENQAVRDRLRKLQEEKGKRGITKDPTSIPGRLQHFLERLFGEFKGDIAEWVKESEPILALRVTNVQLLEWVDWLTYYPFFAFIFLVVTPRLYRRINTYVDRMRGRLMEQTVGEHSQEIARLQRDMTELKALEAVVRGVIGKDPSRLTEDDLKNFRNIMTRAAAIIESLPPEITSENPPEKDGQKS